MTSNIDFSTNATLLTMELDEITFSGLTAGESLAMEFTVQVGQTTVDNWSATYFADSTGSIRLSALGRMWNRYLTAIRRANDSSAPGIMPGMLDVTIKYTMENSTTATCHRYLLYSRRRGSLAQTSYPPFLSRQKQTFQDAKERIWVLSSVSNLTITATAIYVRNATQAIGTVNLSWEVSGTAGGSADVSPSVIAAELPNGAVLKEYNIVIKRSGTTVGSCRYVVDQQAMTHTQLMWLNRWGVYETLSMNGTKTHTPERSVEFGWTGDDWTGLDMEVADEYEGSTGYVGDEEWSQVRDLAESPIVWLWNGMTWHKVTVTGVRLSRSMPSNEARACMVSYRISDREAEWL